MKFSNLKQSTQLLLCLITLMVIPSVAKSCGDNDTGVDPLLHVTLSGIAGYMGESYVHTRPGSPTQKIMIGTAIGSIPGLLKEAIDYAENDEYCSKDMLQNIGGALAGSLLAYNMNKKYKVSFNKQEGNYLFGVSFKD